MLTLMSPVSLFVVIGLAGLIVGAALYFLISQVAMKSKSRRIILEAESEAEVIKRDKILQAKEKFLQLKTDHEQMIVEKTNRLLASENKFKQREINISQKVERSEERRVGQECRSL